MPVKQTQDARWQIVGALFVALSILAVLPIAAVSLPPILDYPNHMARMHIVAALHSSADLARFYKVIWTPVPDLAIDAIVPPLSRFIGVENAMRLFLAAMLIAMAGGCLMLHRVTFRRWSLWPLSAFLLLYNRMLLWGFLNYLAGLTLMLWALAAWVALERRPVALRLCAGMIFTTAIYLAHLAAFGCYALAIIGFSLAPVETFDVKGAMRRAWPSIVTLAPAVALFLMSPTSGAPSSIAYGNILRKLDLPVSIFDNYDRLFDGATFAFLLVAVIFGLVRRGLVLNRRLCWGVLALLIAYVLMPSQFLSASGIDHRLPIAIAFLFIAASDWGSFEWRRTVAAALLVLFLVRMAVIGTIWLRADQDYKALRPAFDLIERGAALAVAAPAHAVQAGGVPLLHFPTLAIIRRDAFVPTLFADPLQQPVQFTESAASLAAEDSPAILWDEIEKGVVPRLPGYDDLMIIDPPPALDPGRLPGRILFTAPRLILLHLTHPAEPVQ